MTNQWMQRFVMITVLATSLLSQAQNISETEGVNSGGGNDPRATELIDYGRTVITWLASTQNASKYPHVKASMLLSRVEKLSETLDNKYPWIRFLDTHEMKCYGVAKKACTSDAGRIVVAGKYWEKASRLEKCETSIVELMRTSKKLKFLYETASALCKYHYQKESKIDSVKSTVAIKYKIYNDVRQSIISFSDRHGYEIFCGGLVSTAYLTVHIGLTKDAKLMDITAGKIIAKRKDLSREECASLQEELASASEENPVAVIIKGKDSFLINSK